MKCKEIIDMSAAELSIAIHSKKVSCVEVMNAYLDHIEENNPQVHAIVNLGDRGDLIRQARERDNMLFAGQDMGWMHGFPQAIKDTVPAVGYPYTNGSPIYKDRMPDKDYVYVDRMRKAGAIVIGKTNVPEFGYGSHCYNTIFETTVNPYDNTKAAGGSSGGAAASVAMHMQAVADGNDGMGSLRNPAGWCNVYGMRPSFGTIPKLNKERFACCMSQDGAIGRRPADVALLLATQAGYDPSDPHCRDIDPRLKALTPENVDDKLHTSIKGTKIAWLGDWGGHLATEDGILSTCEQALDNLTKYGVVVEPIKPFYDPQDLWENVWLPIRSFQVSSIVSTLYKDPETRKMIKPEVIWECENGHGMTLEPLFNAFVKRTNFYNAMMEVYKEYDYIVTPSEQVWPFDAKEHWPKEIAGRKMQTYHNWMEVCIAWTLGCNATVSVPAGFSKAGLPTGMQVVARPRNDFELLQFCSEYEKINNFVEECPPPYCRA